MALPINVFNPTYWSNLILEALFETTFMPDLVTTDFSAEIASSGDTINTSLPGKATLTDMTEGSFSAADTDFALVTLKLDEWKGATYQLGDKAKTFTKKNALELFAIPIAQAFAKQIDLSLFGRYVEVYNRIGTAGTSPTGVDELGTDVEMQFNDQLNDLSGRNVILNSRAQNNWHQAFYNTVIPATDSLINGNLGKRFGMNFFGSQLIPTHTTGCTVGGTLSAGTTVGALSIAITGATGNPKVGDLFMVGGFPYVVNTAATLSTGAATVLVSPPLRTVVASGQTVTATANHVVNMGFTKGAFSLINRAPSIEPQFEIGLVSTVALGGFVLRTQIWRDPKDKRTYMQSDTMYGVKTLDPEKAFRIMG